MALAPELAVSRCLDAYNQACAQHDAVNDYTSESLRRVNLAWRKAMPILGPDPGSIDAFIACVTHGLIYQVFSEAEASKLLYAAQTAIASRRARTQETLAQAKLQTQSHAAPKGQSAAPQVPQSATPQVPQSATPQVPQSAAPQVPQSAEPQVHPIDAILDRLHNGLHPTKAQYRHIDSLVDALSSGTPPRQVPPSPLLAGTAAS